MPELRRGLADSHVFGEHGKENVLSVSRFELQRDSETSLFDAGKAQNALQK